MPVNSLSITKRELRKFEGTAESGRVDITGEYEVTIKNEGVLPILASQYEVQKLSPTSVNKTLITEKSGDIDRLSPGSSESVNISFKISGNKDQLMTLARTGCNGNTIKCNVEEQISGRLLALPFDEKRDLSVSAGSCSLRSDVGQAPPTPEPEPTPSEPVQNLTMRFDEAVSPTEVTAGEENSWVINGNNINEVNQIRVELGDGSTTTTRREMQARNPQQPDNGGSQGLALSRAKQTGANDNTSSGVGQVFRHTYTSQGQYTIVAEAINSNGETVGSARYSVTVNPQVTTDPAEPEPTNPANFNITVDNKNEPVNPGGQMVIDYTVENTGEASGTGNITLNVGGQRADSSRRTVNAGSSTSGTLTATAPQINSSSVIFRPQISAEGVESNTVSPSFEVKQQEDDSEDQRDDRQQPDPAVLNLQITGTSSPVNIGQDLNVQYRVINTGGQSTNAVIDATTSSSNGRQAQVVETVNPGQTVQGELTVSSTAYGTAGEKTATLQVEGDSAQTNFTVQQQNGGQQFGSVNEITNQLDGIDAAREIIRLHGQVIRRYDDNNNGEIDIGELGDAGTAYTGLEITLDELDAIGYMTENGQYFPQNGEAEQRYLNNAELIHQYDENGNGEIDIGENGAAGQDFGQGQLSTDEVEVIQYIFENNIKFPRSLQQQQNTQSNEFLPPSMTQAADNGF